MILASSDEDDAVHVSVGVSDSTVTIYYFQDWIVVEDGFEAYVKALSDSLPSLQVSKSTPKSKRLIGHNTPIPSIKLENIFGVKPPTDNVTASLCEVKIHHQRRFVEVALEFPRPFYCDITLSSEETIKSDLKMF